MKMKKNKHKLYNVIMIKLNKYQKHYINMSNTVTYKNIIITEYFKLILNIKVLKSK